MQQKQNLYLGIDGVILTKGVVPALHLDRFLEFILSAYNVSWLSTRCLHGPDATVEYLSKFVSPETIGLLKKVKVAIFLLDKTEAIDFSREFFWLEPDLFDSERKVLLAHDKLHSWIKLDLVRYPNQLMNLVNNKLYKKVLKDVN